MKLTIRCTIPRRTDSAIAVVLGVSMLILNGISPTEILAAEFDTAHHGNVVGVEAANCKQCHPSEFAQWQKSSHYLSLDKLVYKDNAKKYADALGISAGQLAGNSICSDCHATTIRDNKPVVISGVSCESCHGPAKDWLKAHSTYTDSMVFKNLDQLRQARLAETPDHRQQRLLAVAKAGMIRPVEIESLVRNCASCHIVNNEKLVAAGHKATSAFELVSWSGGEVRHNFLSDKTKNADGPTMWSDSTEDQTAEQKRRVKYVVGTLVQIETALRLRASAKSPAYIPQVGAAVAALNGRLAEINALAGTSETKAVSATVSKLMATLFVPLPNDADMYAQAANNVATQAKSFAKTNDGSGLQPIDAAISRTPPHFSQQHKQKYLTQKGN